MLWTCGSSSTYKYLDFLDLIFQNGEGKTHEVEVGCLVWPEEYSVITAYTQRTHSSTFLSYTCMRLCLASADSYSIPGSTFYSSIHHSTVSVGLMLDTSLVPPTAAYVNTHVTPFSFGRKQKVVLEAFLRDEWLTSLIFWWVICPDGFMSKLSVSRSCFLAVHRAGQQETIRRRHTNAALCMVGGVACWRGGAPDVQSHWSLFLHAHACAVQPWKLAAREPSTDCVEPTSTLT